MNSGESAAATALFWILLAVPLGAFVVYPVSMAAYSRLRRPLRAPDGIETWPRLTLIISAYNEEAVIRRRLLNALRLRYPADRLEILVATDGSTDRTDAIVESFAGRGVRLLRSARNRGKTAALNDAVRAARGEILVFSDANSLYSRDALERLARWFALREVGCVCGRLRYTDGGRGAGGRGERRYWNFDTRLKRWEGASGALLGANGAIFALRRELAEPIGGEQSNDMVWPILARLRGFRVVFEPRAVAREETAGSARGEGQRKARIIARGLHGVALSLRWALREARRGETPPAQLAFSLYQILLKKAFRYLSAPCALAAALAGLFSPEPLVRGAALAFWFALAIAALNELLRPALRKLLPRWPSAAYPLAMAAASRAGVAMALRGRDLSRGRSQRPAGTGGR